jgi:hypothetical protein
MTQTKYKNKNHSRQRLAVPVTALLSHRVRRKLEKLEQEYLHDESGKRIKRLMEEIEGFCDAEIDAGRVVDSPPFWVAIYSHALVSVKAKTNSLIGNLSFKLMRTGGGKPGEQAKAEEVQRDLSRFAAEIERKLASASEYMELAGSAETPSSSTKASKTAHEPVALGQREVVGMERAIIVEKIRREMVEIAEAVELPEDFDKRIRSNHRFAKYTTVSVCNRHPDLKEKLCSIKTTKKPRVIEIACEIATRSANNTETKPIGRRTFQDAHKRYGRKAKEQLNRQSDINV